MVQEVREIMAQLGIRQFDDLMGWPKILSSDVINHWKAHTVNLSALLYRSQSHANSAV